MRLYYGTYGHHLSGKLYVYWGDDNLRTGQQVVAPVTNKRSGRTYNTMFTISKSSSEKNAAGEVGRLEGQGIFIKTINGETCCLCRAENHSIQKRRGNAKVKNGTEKSTIFRHSKNP